MSSDVERKKRLESFSKTFADELDRTIVQQHKELRRWYVQEFDSHMNKAEECAKNRDFLGAEQHRLYAEMIDLNLQEI